MALESIQSGSPPAGRELSQALVELQGLSIDLVAGAAADAAITVTGIGTEDTILSVIHNTAGTLADLTAEATITDDDEIQLGTTDTTGDQLLVFWYDKGAL